MLQVFTQKENQLIWRSNGETLVIIPWGENSLRVRSAMMHEAEDTRYSLLTPALCQAEIVIGNEEASIVNGNIKAVVRHYNWGMKSQISFYNQKGKLLLRECDGGGALNTTPRFFKPIPGGDHQLTVSFEGFHEEKLYGMGQYQQDQWDIKHCSFELAHRNSQASVPIVLSSRGYGFLWHNPAIGRATFARNKTEWYAASTKQMDYWITAGDTPAQIEEAYAKATGTVPMMPEYGMGFWQCKLRYWNQEQLLTVAREYKRRNIPLDLIVCDFFHWPKMGDYRFDPEFFPDPKAMADELKQMGVELMVSVWPQIDQKSENFEEMKQLGLLVKPEFGVNVCMQFGGDSVFFDATNPEAQSFVWEKCNKNYYKHGIRVFWLDEAEPEYGTYDFENYRYYIGSNLQIGNVYPQLYSRAFYEGMEKEGQTNIINLVRCAWSGSQRYGALVWSGDIHSDFPTLKRQICAGLHMGLAGIPWWTTDIGGFGGGNPKDEGFRELLIRWFQWGAFCPVMRLHGDRQPSTPLTGKDGRPALFTGGDNEVWSFGEEVYEILVKYLRLREAMRDYIRSVMRDAHEKGTPVMRAMFYEYPEDRKCWDLSDQYMFGSDVLAAPVTEKGAVSRPVYLPEGVVWTELGSGKEYKGGQTILADAPIQIMPAFLKNGKHKEWVGLI
jgi:alpha-D-xyloside xylohydrolase